MLHVTKADTKQAGSRIQEHNLHWRVPVTGLHIKLISYQKGSSITYTAETCDRPTHQTTKFTKRVQVTAWSNAFSRGRPHHTNNFWLYTDHLFKIRHLTHTEDAILNKKTWSCTHSPAIGAVAELGQLQQMSNHHGLRMSQMCLQISRTARFGWLPSEHSILEQLHRAIEGEKF